MCWVHSRDKRQFTVKVNFLTKKKKVETETNFCEEKIHKTMPTTNSKRMVLAQINSIYESLGLATEFTMMVKMLMIQFLRAVVKHLGCDDNIPYLLKEKWIMFFQKLFQPFP